MFDRQRMEILPRRVIAAVDRRDLIGAGADLQELSEIAHDASWEPADGERRILLMIVANLAQRLGDARSELKQTSGALDTYRLALRALRAAGGDETAVPMAECAESICRLFRYRLTAGGILSGFREVMGDSDAARELAAELLDDPDVKISYWHNWSAEAASALDEAAAVYGDLMSYDAERYLPNAATIRMDVARKLQDSSGAVELSLAADLARKASHTYSELTIYDRAKWNPLLIEALHLSCRLHWKVKDYEGAQRDGEEALELYRQMGGEARPESLVRMASLAAMLASSYEHKGQAQSAVGVLERLLEPCRSMAREDPQVGEPILANTLYYLGLAYMHAEDGAKTEEALAEALRISRKLAALDGDEYAELLTAVLEMYASLRSDTGRWELAIDLEAEAERWRNKKFFVS